ncbi:MAG: hypothetical protein JOY91_12940 [Sinobacteraceae bacterium]|nr:hypothetical protein [Nevskiaceae bacterium]
MKPKNSAASIVALRPAARVATAGRPDAQLPTVVGTIALLTVAVLAITLLSGCDQLGFGHKGPVDDGAPSEQQLQQISYMSTRPGPNGRKLYDHYEQAHSCADYELAMRWNRPPNIVGGTFQKKLRYLTHDWPADVGKDTEVFLTGTIEKGETLPSGAAGWYVRMGDGALVQLVEMPNFLQQEDQDTEPGKPKALDKPNSPGRMLCGQGVVQGQTGKDPEGKPIPLVSMLYAMDREKPVESKEKPRRH